MRKILMGLLLSTAMMVLGSCGSEPIASDEATAAKPDYNKVAVIQHPSRDTIFANGVHYVITEKTHFSAASGEEIQPETLKPGDLVELAHEDATTDTLPGKGILVSLTLHDDEQSRSISQAVAHVMENQEVGDITFPEIKSVSNHLVTLQFRDSKHEQKFECIVNTDSMQFHIKPVVHHNTKKHP